jgi:hypothetical protein
MSLTRRPRLLPEGAKLTDAKAHARAAYERTRAAGGPWSLTATRAWADTLLAVEHKPAVTQAEMFRRTEHLLVLLHDRSTWERADRAR